MRRSGIVVFALLIAVAIVCLLYFLFSSPDHSDTAERALRAGGGAIEEPAPAKADEAAQRKKAAMRKLAEAIIAGKWIKPEHDGADSSVSGAFLGPCRTETDKDGDGKPDSIEVINYSDDGKVALFEIDKDADGIVDLRRELTFDEFGELTASKRDGAPGFAVEKIRDDEGNLVKALIDLNGDGETDVTQESTYDGDGFRLTQRVKTKSSDIETSFTYDDGGNLLTRLRKVVPVGEGALEESVTSFIYDEAGNLVREATTGDDPRTITYTQDEHGNRTSKVVDEGSDGKPDRIWKTEYDDRSNKLVEEFDSDGDGTVDERKVHRYDCWK